MFCLGRQFQFKVVHPGDGAGGLHVGPQSAGSEPGPVCYGTGGELPAITDADLVLGYIDPDYFLGGRRRLDKPAAVKAMEEKIAGPLGLSAVEAAAGIVRIIDSKMSDLIRREIIKSGHLPEDFVLYAFGGASPVHAVGYARDLGVREIIVFPTTPLKGRQLIMGRFALDETAEGNVFAELRMREADLEKHLSGADEQKDEARAKELEKIREERRAKLEADPAEPCVLLTEPGVGYRIAEPG